MNMLFNRPTYTRDQAGKVLNKSRELFLDRELIY